MKKMVLEFILKITEKALKINNEHKNTIFIYFMGHINSIEFHVYKNGWKKNIDADYHKWVSLYTEDAEKELREVYDELTKIELSYTNENTDSSK